MAVWLPTLKPRSSNLWTWLFALLAYRVAFCRPMRFVCAVRRLDCSTRSAARCSAGLCWRMVGIGALSLRIRDEHLHEEPSLRIVLAAKVKTMGRSRLPWSVVGFRFTLLAVRASGIRGSSRSETCLRNAFSRPRSFASLFLAPAPRWDMLPKKLPESAPGAGPAQHLPLSALC